MVRKTNLIQIMYKAIKKFFSSILSPRTNAILANRNPPKIDFRDFESNFYKRTYSFSYYRGHLISKNPRLLQWIGSIDYSGYQREKSLRYLVEHFTIGDENRILLRLEDWVKEVRQVAQKWVEDDFEKLSLEQIYSNYKVILYLNRKEILKSNETLRFINESILNKASEINDSIFHTLHVNFRRYIYTLAEEKDQQFRSRMLHDKDPFCRILFLAKYIFSELAPEELCAFRNDRSVFVKRIFIQLQTDNQEYISRDDLEQYCLDKNKGIRSLATFYLNKWYNIDSYTIYKAQTDYKFYYISDSAKKEDLNEFINGFETGDTKIKFLCLKAICSIDYHLLTNMNSIELLSAPGKIRHLGCQYLYKVLSIEELLGLRDDIISIQSNGYQVYLNLIYKKSSWHFISESLDVLMTQPSDESFKYIYDIFNQKPYIYDKLNIGLKKEILERIDMLSSNKEHHIQSFIKTVRVLMTHSHLENK